jgi:hypothetical protein
LLVGLVIYFTYSRKHSKLNEANAWFNNRSFARCRG